MRELELHRWTASVGSISTLDFLERASQSQADKSKPFQETWLVPMTDISTDLCEATGS